MFYHNQKVCKEFFFFFLIIFEQTENIIDPVRALRFVTLITPSYKACHVSHQHKINVVMMLKVALISIFMNQTYFNTSIAHIMISPPYGATL